MPENRPVLDEDEHDMADDTDETVDNGDYDYMNVVQLSNPEEEDEEDDPDFEDCLLSPKRICAAEVDDASSRLSSASNETSQKVRIHRIAAGNGAEVKRLSTQLPHATKLLSMRKQHKKVPKT